MTRKTFSRHTRSAIETRAQRMLPTLSTSATIRAEMEAHVYTESDHDPRFSQWARRARER
jgi:hypothetical protein